MTDEQKAAARARFSGAAHPRWNGGTYINERGYVFVRPQEDWPWPEMVDRRGYLRKHRMVMALHLGRPILRPEIVHHRDGNPGNNDLDNLEIKASHVEHMADHWREGTVDKRPMCVFGCGRRTHLNDGRRYHGCARCRRLKRYRQDPRATATY